MIVNLAIGSTGGVSPVARSHRKGSGPSELRRNSGGLKTLSGGVSQRVNRRYARSAVWWRRGELNPCPKIVSALCLHV